jgi:hypothetical protein
LDAEKYFDRVWHDGLFYKLLPRIAFNHWLMLCEWYTKLKAVITWNGTLSDMFIITRGICQGSILSPLFFNMFIDDLLKELSNTNHGLRLAHNLYNNFAYADDVNLLATCVPGLQILIDKCVAYTNKWRFVFGFKKTKQIIFGKDILTQRPVWLLGCNAIETTDDTDILGVKFSSNLSSAAHVAHRISSARRRAFSLLNDGLCYPGLASGVKSYSWKTAVHACPILTSGCHTIDISAKSMSLLEGFQSKIIKRIFGLPLRSHHSKVLMAGYRHFNILANEE